MLLGVDLSTFDIGAISEGDYYVKFTLRNKCDGFKWVLYAVYGPGQQEHKESFLIELANSCSRETLPYVIGGDFNIMRCPEDKSTDNFDFKWPNIFNQVIEVLDLKEIEMSGRQFTWASYGDNPIFEKLDRVLVTTKWEEKFPISSVQSRDRGISDHTPIVLNTGASTHMNNQPRFKFEIGWFLRDGFFDMVANIWQSEIKGDTNMERWQNKIRALCKHLWGWARHTAGHYKKEKKKLLSLIDSLDKKAEASPLSDNEINMKHYLKERLVILLREEEMKWYERAKVNTLLQGDDNTQFFQLVANGKHRKQHIYQLEREDGIIVGDEQLKSYITDYYKGLFGPSEDNTISLQDNLTDDIPQVSSAENDI